MNKFIFPDNHILVIQPDNQLINNQNGLKFT